MPEGSEENQQSPDSLEEGINRRVKDYCRILGVKTDASPEDIKKGFRRLALRYHPDRNSGNAKEAEDRFREIDEAYEVLSNEQKSHQYDCLTSYGRSQTGMVRVGKVFGDRLDDSTHRNLEDVIRILAALNLDRNELFMERRKGCRKFLGGRQCWHGYWR